ncbi:MAG: ATP-dependent helicase, partial [Oscillatoriales cyanobacterium]
MARSPILTFDRGTLILHPPPKGRSWIEFAVWDDRIEKFRIPAHQYRPLVERLRAEAIEFQDEAKAFEALELTPRLQMTPYPHQQEA